MNLLQKHTVHISTTNPPGIAEGDFIIMLWLWASRALATITMVSLRGSRCHAGRPASSASCEVGILVCMPSRRFSIRFKAKARMPERLRCFAGLRDVISGAAASGTARRRHVNSAIQTSSERMVWAAGALRRLKFWRMPAAQLGLLRLTGRSSSS